jgi:hypothetical protein
MGKYVFFDKLGTYFFSMWALQLQRCVRVLAEGL